MEDNNFYKINHPIKILLVSVMVLLLTNIITLYLLFQKPKEKIIFIKDHQSEETPLLQINSTTQEEIQNTHNNLYQEYYNQNLTIEYEENDIIGMPYTIKVPNTNIDLVRSDNSIIRRDEFSGKKLFKYNDSDYIYKEKSTNCFIAIAKNGAFIEYYFDLDFVKELEHDSDSNHFVLDFSFPNGQQNQNIYMFERIGERNIFSRSCYLYADYITDIY